MRDHSISRPSDEAMGPRDFAPDFEVLAGQITSDPRYRPHVVDILRESWRRRDHWTVGSMPPSEFRRRAFHDADRIIGSALMRYSKARAEEQALVLARLRDPATREVRDLKRQIAIMRHKLRRS